jgi:mono/diheme cytochrome c family protein
MAAAVPAGITIPDLTGDAAKGLDVFAANCVSCHGPHATGTDSGPPLVHIIYEPSHHGDGAFYAAVRNGVRQHHWPYGNMPAVPGVSDAKTGLIIAYIRTLQRANGIN